MPPWMVKKIAGVPVWGWGIAALGAIALGLYFRHRAVVASSTGSSTGGPTGMDDLANSLAGGTTDGAAAGLDPELAGLLSSAFGALGTGDGGGFTDGGGFFDGGGGATDSGGDTGGGSNGGDSGGQDTGGGTNVGSSGAGTTWNPGPGYTGGGFLTLSQFTAGQSVAPYAGANVQHPGSNASGVSINPRVTPSISGSYAGGYVAPPQFTPLSSPNVIRVASPGTGLARL